MLALSSCEGLENPVIIRDWRMATKRKTYRIYMEYAPRGDLYQWMRRYRPSLPSPLESLTARFPDPTDEQIEQYDAEKEQHDEKVREFHAVRDTREREWLPEAWIWHCFESLEKAVVLMAQGTLAPDPPDPWEPIIHLDWKPSNVFLGLPSGERFARWPQLKLDDFYSPSPSMTRRRRINTLSKARSTAAHMDKYSERWKRTRGLEEALSPTLPRRTSGALA